MGVRSNKGKYNVCLLGYTVYNPFLVIRFTFWHLSKCCLSCMRYLNAFKYSHSPPPSNWSWESFPLQFPDVKYFTLWLTRYGFSFLMSWLTPNVIPLSRTTQVISRQVALCGIYLAHGEKTRTITSTTRTLFLPHRSLSDEVTATRVLSLLSCFLVQIRSPDFVTELHGKRVSFSKSFLTMQMHWKSLQKEFTKA